MSKKLDEELAQAIASNDPPGIATPVRPRSEPRVTPPQKKNLGLLLTLLVMVGAIVALFLGVFKPAAVYATPVDQLVSDGPAFVGRKVRVEGELVPGTLVKRDAPCEYRFTLHKAAADKKDDVRLPVRYAQCVIPDGFRDVPTGGVQVTVEGALGKEGDFDASLVMAKCSSKYDPQKHEMKDGNLPVN